MKFFRSFIAFPTALVIAAISYLVVGICVGYMSQIVPIDAVRRLLLWSGEFMASMFFSCMLLWSLYVIAPKGYGRLPLIITIGWILVPGNFYGYVAVNVALALPPRAWAGMGLGVLLAFSYILQDSKRKALAATERIGT